MSYTVSYISDKDSILNVLQRLEPQLRENYDVTKVIDEAIQLTSCKLGGLSEENRRCLNETLMYYKYNQSQS